MATRRRLSKARRDEILQAAVHVISRRGLCDTRISDIAARTGTSSALILYYFESKDQLLTEALLYAEDRFYATVAEELAKVERATGRLLRLIELSCSGGTFPGESWEQDWVLWIDMWARAPRDEHVARHREALDARWRATIAEIVGAGQAAGEFEPVDADDFAVWFAALVDGLVIQAILNDPEVSPERMQEICIRMAARELGFEVPDGAGGGRRTRRAGTGNGPGEGVGVPGRTAGRRRTIR